MKRKLSWLFALLAYFGPPALAYSAIEADRRAQLASHDWLCGTPMIGIVFLAVFASGLFSLIAGGFGIAAFRALPRPRGGKRIGELGILLAPALFGVAFLLLLVLA